MNSSSSGRRAANPSPDPTIPRRCPRRLHRCRRLVITIVVSLTLIPLAVGVGALLVWLAAALILGWAGIELLAALERWLENDPRFQR